LKGTRGDKTNSLKVKPLVNPKNTGKTNNFKLKTSGLQIGLLSESSFYHTSGINLGRWVEVFPKFLDPW